MNCRYCKSELKGKAKACHVCGRFQDLRRFIENANIPFAILLGLVTMLSAKPIVELVEEKESIIGVSIISGDNEKIEFMIANNGNQPAGIESFEIRYEPEQDNSIKLIYLNDDLKNKLLAPGQAAIVTAEGWGMLPRFIPHEVRQGTWLDRNCSLQVSIIELNGVKKSCIFHLHVTPFHYLRM